MNFKNKYIKNDLLDKKQKGITLIALVITIIVLLILAGVTMVMVIKDDGIITQADTAKEKQQKEDDIQEISLAVSSEDLKVAMNGGKRNVDNIQAELMRKYSNNVNVIDYSNGNLIIILEGRKYSVDGYGNVEKYNGTVTPVPTQIATISPTVTTTPTSTPSHTHTTACYHYCYNTPDECYTYVACSNPECDNSYVSCGASMECGYWSTDGLCHHTCFGNPSHDVYQHTGEYCSMYGQTCPERVKCEWCDENGNQKVNNCQYGGYGSLQCGY